VELVYQDWRTDWFPAMAQEMLDQFHTEHPTIRVFYTPDPEDYQEKMLADMQAGTAADVFQGCCTHFPTWAQMGYALDLRPYVESDLEQLAIEDWDRAQYSALSTSDGLQYGLPKYHGALALYYNKDIFDRHGVAYPDGTWDHDDYLLAMERLTHDRSGDGHTDLWPACWMLRGIASRPTSTAGEDTLWTRMMPQSRGCATLRRWRRWSGCALAYGMIT
jgi:multiple sugar transport system substrate-binding protein